MADHKHGEMDTSTHQKTFENFMGWTKWTAIAIIALIVFMAIFIT